jgi:hypothetical protein
VRSCRCTLSAIVTLVLLVTPVIVLAQAPSPIVERWLTVGTRTVRTSLFENRMAVVSVTRGDERVLFRRIELPEDEFIGYLAAVQRDAKELARTEDRLRTESMGGYGKIILHVGPKVPLTIEYSPVAVLGLATSRLVAALDDLERRMLWGEQPATDLKGWKPQIGDRVELRTGIKATVVDIYDDGTVVLEHDGVSIHERVPPDSLAVVVARVLEDES